MRDGGAGREESVTGSLTRVGGNLAGSGRHGASSVFGGMGMAAARGGAVPRRWRGSCSTGVGVGQEPLGFFRGCVCHGAPATAAQDQPRRSAGNRRAVPRKASGGRRRLVAAITVLTFMSAHTSVCNE